MSFCHLICVSDLTNMNYILTNSVMQIIINLSDHRISIQDRQLISNSIRHIAQILHDFWYFCDVIRKNNATKEHN